MKKLFFYLLILFAIASCNSIKRVADGEQLLRANKVFVDGKKNKSTELTDFLIQKPNSRVLGFPLAVYFYNIGNPEYPKTPKKWGEENPKKYHFLKNIFSEKQSIGAAKSYINFNNWFLTGGEAPEIIDDKKTKKTVDKLNTYFQTQGYFKNTVTSQKDSLSPKKGAISYHITKGKPLFLDKITTTIESPVLDSIYKTAKTQSFLQSGKQYNDLNFRKEAARITKLFRNAGVYHFTVSDDVMRFDVNTERADNKTNVLLTIAKEYRIEKNGHYTNKPFAVNRLRKITIYTDYTYAKKDDAYLDTIHYNGIDFVAHDKAQYNPKYLSQSIFIKPHQAYNDSIRNLTRNHLKSLKNFKAITINYKPVENTNLLDAEIYLMPIEKYTIGTETELTHSNLRKLGVSAKFSITNRNAFKGAELLKYSFSGAFFNTAAKPANSSGFFNAWEIGTEFSLEIPRFVAPFGLNKLVPKSMSPKTLFSLGTGIQKNIGLDKQTFSAAINYNWSFNPRKSINLELLNFQYIRNLNVSDYFNVYTSEFNKLQTIATTYYNDPNYTLQKSNAVSFINTIKSDTSFKQNNPADYKNVANTDNRYKIITSNFIIPAIAYSFTYNSQTNYKDNNFSFFRVRVANSGNFFALLANKKNSNGVKTISDTPIAQYFKTDIEYKHFWDLSQNSVIGFRSFLGAIFPYGNSSIPFTKSYFAGGSNDIRAWKTYNLGPGATAPGLEYNIGSLKFLTSLEYRFDLIGNLKGALFVDAGNIWDITNSKFINANAKFSGLKSLKQIAVGTGFGARYDFSFLILRLDVGFKTYEPYLSNNRWFNNYNFKNAVFNIGINYPF